jgi:long-chain acyl-CoA synthetase
VSNLASLLERNVRRRPDDECLVQPEPDRRSLTWAELAASVEAVAAGFAAGSPESGHPSGLVAGQRVGLQGSNSIEYLIAYLAILRAGLVAVPIDPHLGPDGVQQLRDEAGLELVLGGLERPLTRDGLQSWVRHGHSPVVSPPDPEALAVLLRTAGTSGEPRLAMLSHRALLAQVSRSWFSGLLEESATVLGALPLAHVFGLGAVVGGWLAAGARLVLTEGSSERLVAVIADEEVDHLPLTPTLLFRLLQGLPPDPGPGNRMAHVQRVLVAGAAVPDWLAREFTARTGVRVDRGYGLTEAASGVSATFDGPALGPSHVGRPLPGVEVRIGDGLDPAEPGRIALRGDSLFSGYWPDGTDGPDADGWFVTDDLGYVRDGELFLVDRSREVVVVHGFPVYPAEVEQAIRELPRVRSVAVVGTADPRSGTRIVAFVSGQELSGAQVAEHCRRRLAPYKRPAEIRLLDSLPRGVTGEIRRGPLRRMLSDEQLSVSGTSR